MQPPVPRRGRPALAIPGASTLARNLRTARAQRGLSMRDLARLAGIPEDSLGRYETGRREPGAAKLFDLAQVLGVSMDALMSPDFPDKLPELS